MSTTVCLTLWLAGHLGCVWEQNSLNNGMHTGTDFFALLPLCTQRGGGAWQLCNKLTLFCKLQTQQPPFGAKIFLDVCPFNWQLFCVFRVTVILIQLHQLNDSDYFCLVGDPCLFYSWCVCSTVEIQIRSTNGSSSWPAHQSKGHVLSWSTSLWRF